MLQVLTLSVVLALTGAPADLAPAPAVTEAPVQCADATLGQSPGPLFVGLGDFGELSVTCSVDCDGDGTEETSCTGTTCSAVDRDCANGRKGYVECDGSYTYCPLCPCTDGDIRILPTGNCCDCYDSGGEEKDVEECVNGSWVYQYSSCFPSSSCPICQ